MIRLPTHARLLLISFACAMLALALFLCACAPPLAPSLGFEAVCDDGRIRSGMIFETEAGALEWGSVRTPFDDCVAERR